MRIANLVIDGGLFHYMNEVETLPFAEALTCYLRNVYSYVGGNLLHSCKHYDSWGVNSIICFRWLKCC